MDQEGNGGLLQGESPLGGSDYPGDFFGENGGEEIPLGESARPLGDPEGIGPGGEILTEDFDGWPLCQEPTCQARIEEYSGSGRRPKYHPNHRPSVMGKPPKKPRGSSSVSTGQSDKSLDAKLKKIALDFAENIALVGILVTPLLPTTGYIISRDATDTATAVVKMARNNPAVLAALMKASQIGPGVMLGRTIITIGVAVAVDTNRVTPDSQISTMLGVAAVWQEVHGEQGKMGPANGWVTPPPPARII
jgi:hypothetical protein